MFAMIPLDGDMERVISYFAGADRFADLVEQEGFVPAPYLARAFWVAAETWRAHRDAVWEAELRAAHGLMLAKLPPKVRKTLELSASELKKLVAHRRAKLAAKGKAS
jgi:predicted DNA-binding protein (MmcQ/YjbR family)